MESFTVREGSAQRLAIYLVGIGGVAFVGASAAEVLTASFVNLGALFGAHVLLMGLAIVAAVLEWTRERWAESVAIAALGFALVLTLVDMVNGVWYFAPFLGVMTLAGIFALVNRYIVRDEARHAPRVV